LIKWIGEHIAFVAKKTDPSKGQYKDPSGHARSPRVAGEVQISGADRQNTLRKGQGP